MKNTWINAYIGLPWQKGAQGPLYYDCLGLVKEVLSKHYGVNLPNIQLDYASLLKVVRAIKNHDGWLEWEKTDIPTDGGLVKLYRGQEPDHIGIWVDVEGGGILHSLQALGVCFERPFVMKAAGWQLIEYFKYRGE